jgi:hypothetical protein
MQRSKANRFVSLRPGDAGWAQAACEIIGYVQSPCSAMEAAFA